MQAELGIQIPIVPVSLASLNSKRKGLKMKEAEIIYRFNQPVVDLEADWDCLPDGWRFVLEDNCYTGWGSSNGVRWACVEKEVSWPSNKVAIHQIDTPHDFNVVCSVLCQANSMAIRFTPIEEDIQFVLIEDDSDKMVVGFIAYKNGNGNYFVLDEALPIDSEEKEQIESTINGACVVVG